MSNHKHIQTSPVPHCPDCGAQMRLIHPRQGDDWDDFWGCTEYRKSDCRGSRNIDEQGRPIFRDDETGYRDQTDAEELLEYGL